MINRYHDIFTTGRSPERADALSELVSILCDTNYSDDLCRIEDIVALYDSLELIVAQAESLVFSCTISLLQRMGLTISHESLNKNPQVIVEILQFVLEQAEHFDDYDTLLAILDSGETETVLISNMVGFVLGTSPYRYIDIIEDVQEKLIRSLQSILNAKAIKELDEARIVNQQLTDNVIKYLEQFANTPISHLLGSYGFTNSLDELIEDTYIDPDQYSAGGQYLTDVALAAAGIALTETTDFNEAYALLDIIIPQLLADGMDDKLLLVGQEARQVLVAVMQPELPEESSEQMHE